MERRSSQTSSRCEYRPGLKKAHRPSNRSKKIECGRSWNTNAGVGRHQNSWVTIVSALQIPLYESILGDFLNRNGERLWLGVCFDTHLAFCISTTMNGDSRPILNRVPFHRLHHFLYVRANPSVYGAGKMISQGSLAFNKSTAWTHSKGSKYTTPINNNSPSF